MVKRRKTRKVNNRDVGENKGDQKKSRKGQKEQSSSERNKLRQRDESRMRDDEMVGRDRENVSVLAKADNSKETDSRGTKKNINEGNMKINSENSFTVIQKKKQNKALKRLIKVKGDFKRYEALTEDEKKVIMGGGGGEKKFKEDNGSEFIVG